MFLHLLFLNGFFVFYPCVMLGFYFCWKYIYEIDNWEVIRVELEWAIMKLVIHHVGEEKKKRECVFCCVGDVGFVIMATDLKTIVWRFGYFSCPSESLVSLFYCLAKAQHCFWMFWPHWRWLMYLLFYNTKFEFEVGIIYT